MTASTEAQTLTDENVRTMVTEWYRALDRHDPLDDVVNFLASDGLTMTFPEGTFRGLGEFTTWYHNVTNRFFDEVHEVTEVQVASSAPDRAVVKVVVNWQAKVWDPPEATSKWLGFDAYQTWTVVLENDTVRILEYVVDDLAAMPGSATL